MQLIVRKGISILALMLVILLLLAALCAAALKTLAPMGGKYTDNIQHAVSQLIGRPVRIGHLEFTVSGLTPTARLKDLVIYDQAGDTPEMSFEGMDITLDMLTSALKQEWIPRKIILRGSRILVDRTLDGRFIVSGFDFSENRTQNTQNLDILNNLTFQVQDLEVYWNDEPLGLSYQLHTDEMDVFISQTAVALNGVITLPEGIGSDVELAVDIKGPLQQYREWRGNFSASTADLELAGFAQVLASEVPIQLNQGKARFVIWGNWEGDDVLQAVADLALSDVELDLKKTSIHETRVVVDKLETRIDLALDQGHWQASSNSLDFVTNGKQWPDSAYSVNFKLDKRKLHGLSVNVDLLDIASAGSLLNSLSPLEYNWTTYVDSHQPQGTISNLNISYTGMTDEQGNAFLASGEFADVLWQQADKIPGVGELSGNFQIGSDSGTVDIQSDQLAFSSDRMFEQVLRADEFNAELQWQKISDAIDLSINNLSITNTDISLSGGGGFKIAAGLPAVIDLQLSSPGAELPSIFKYLPLSLKPKVRDWIKQGLIGGRGDDVSFSIAGPLSKAAFKERELKLNGTVFASGLTVHYLNDFPDITEVSGLVTFTDYGLKADLKSGAVHGSNITSGWVGIENYFQSIVKLDTRSKGTAVGGIEYLENSKLGEKILPFLASVETNGEVKLGLQIELPLGKMRDIHPRIIKGTVDLKDNLLALPANNIEFLNAKGTVAFNGASFDASNIRARFRGNSVVGSIVTKEDREIHINVSGRMEVEQLLPDNKLLSDISSGNALWNGTVILPSRSDAAIGVKQKLVLSSRLLGTELNLPDPVGKQADDIRQVQIEMFLTPDNRLAKVSYGSDLYAAIELVSNGSNFSIPRMSITCGTEQPELPNTGYRLIGSCGEIDLPSWITKVRDLNAVKVVGTKAAGTKPTFHVDSSFELIAFGGQSFRDVDVVLTSNDTFWDVDLESKAIAGTMRIPDDLGEERRFIAELKQLHIVADEGQGQGQLSPKSVPGLDISVEEFVYNEKNLGTVNLLSSRKPVGMQIEELDLLRDGIVANIVGSWNEVGQNSSVSQLEMEVEGKDFGSLLSDLGVNKNMRAGEGLLYADVSWQGVPYKIDFETLSGVLNGTLRQGSLADVEPGLARVFGLINFDNLPKRIGLQFQDVAGEGLHYEKLSGRVAIEKGVATLDSVAIESDTANIGLAGSADLAAKTYALDMAVVPNVTSTVPLATAIIAGPQTGALVYLLDKVTQGLGVDFNKSITQSYTISGSWEEPDIKQVKIQQIDDEEDNLFEGD